MRHACEDNSVMLQPVTAVNKHLSEYGRRGGRKVRACALVCVDTKS